MLTYMNYAIIGVTVLISYLAWQNRDIMERGIFWPPAVNEGEKWRLLTYGVLHADGSHLLFNMITLYFFGGLIEKYFVRMYGDIGHWFYLLYYLGGLLVSIFPSYLKHKNNPRYRSLGASGAVSAVLFAFILFSPWSMIIVFVVPMPAIVYAVLYTGYSIWMGKRGGDNINHSAHMWGALYGVVALIALNPNLFTHFVNELLNPNF